MTGKELFIQAGEHLAKKRVAEALASYRLAESANYDPDQCAAGRWRCHMLRGDFDLAWRESEAILQRGKPDPHRFWDGRPFKGRRVLMRCLHGLGDTLQFVRYAPLIREQARSLTIEAQPKLKALLAETGLADRVITWGEPESAWDQQVEVMELPQLFRTCVGTIPGAVPYIDVRDDDSHCFRARASLFNVGIVWKSGAYNPERSVPIEQLARLFDVQEVAFVSLQAGSENAEVTPWATHVEILPDRLTGILDTARTLKKLDLVITVDTMTAHLAGAMGRPVWTLLPYECDWRWMLERLDSPWYPTMRLFRQPARGDWAAVVEQVRLELMATSVDRSQSPAEGDSSATLVQVT